MPPCLAPPYHTSPYQTPPYHTPPYHTIPYHTHPYYTPPYHTHPYSTPPYHTHPYHTPPYHTPPYHTPPYQTPPYHKPTESEPETRGPFQLSDEVVVIPVTVGVEGDGALVRFDEFDDHGSKVVDLVRFQLFVFVLIQFNKLPLNDGSGRAIVRLAVTCPFKKSSFSIGSLGCLWQGDKHTRSQQQHCV